MTENQGAAGEEKLSYRERQRAARRSQVGKTSKKVQMAVIGAIVLAIALAGLDYVRRKRAAAAPPPDDDRPAFMFDDNVAKMEADAKKPKDDITLDLGNGVKMPFVWVQEIGAWVGQYEVTNQQYKRFDREHNAGKLEGQAINGDRQPVVMVTYHHVQAFVKWVSNTCSKQIPELYRVRLLDDQEAMAVMLCGKKRDYPWGAEWPPPPDWNYQGSEGLGNEKKIDGHRDPWPVSCPVDQAGRNEWGLYGIGDNVTEWTEKLLDRGSSGTGSYLLMGGSWFNSDQKKLRCDHRARLYSKYATEYIGFRLVIGP